jgi:outer membrane receptor protein involved in Fe transport
MTGADALIDRMSQDETQIDSAGVPWQDNRDLAATHLLGATRVGTDLRLGSLGRLRAGVRLDGARIAADDQMTGSDGSDTMAALSPRLAFELWPADRATVTLAYGRGLRLPEAAAIAADPSMPGALPVAIARSDNAELGAKVQIADGLVLQTAAFGSWLSSEVIFDHAVGRTIARGTTRRLGVEAAIRYQLAPWMELRSDITAVDGRFTDSDEEIPNAPRLVASAGGEAMHPSGFMGSALFRYIGARPLAFGATGQQQAVLDLSAGYRTSRYEIRALIDNALGSEFREAEFNYASDFGGGSTSNLPQLHYSPGRPLSGRLVLTAWF